MSQASNFVRIKLPVSVTGAKLIDIVRAIAGRDYRADPLNCGKYGVFRIGLATDSPGGSMIVAPWLGDTTVNPKATYQEIVVMQYMWHGLLHMVSGDDKLPLVGSVRELADELKRRFGVVESQSAWPQQINVCPDCELPLWEREGTFSCRNHGDYIRRLVVAVVPV